MNESGTQRNERNIRYSVIVPVYLNADSIAEVVARLESLNKSFSGQVEAIFVVDGSPDASYPHLISLLPKAKFASRLVSHSRNFGSFAAIKTGFSLAKGEYMAVMAADLQEPEELVADFFRELSKGESEIALGVRRRRSDPLLSRFSSSVFWWMYKMLVQPEIPAGGVDVFAVRRSVAKTLVEMSESHSSLVGQLMWVGYIKSEVLYDRQPRKHGKSAWSFLKKVRYLNDSIYSFTSLPISIILAVGVVGTVLSGILALTVFSTWLFGGIEVPGYTTQVIVQLLSTGSVLFALGILGTYIWRTYENSKQRPRSIVMSDEAF
jgi:glycosyltransferase involved in cell wall biosynthesis